jgi:uncharacterized protein YaeQ
MALKPTIYKFNVALSDIDANRYLDLNLTLAQHPSETVERMMVRLLAFCINAEDGLEFSRGLSNNEEPDLWQHSLDGQILKWIEVGEPSAERLRKASRIAGLVQVYTFNSKSDTWWRQSCAEIEGLGIEVWQLQWQEIGQLAKLVQRTLSVSITISGQSAFVATDTGSAEINWREMSAD